MKKLKRWGRNGLWLALVGAGAFTAFWLVGTTILLSTWFWIVAMGVLIVPLMWWSVGDYFADRAERQAQPQALNNITWHGGNASATNTNNNSVVIHVRGDK